MSETLIYSYIEDIAKRLHDPALHGAASVMVGAGFSKNADVVDDETSAPNWEELAVSMFEVLYKKPRNEADIKDWKIQKIKKTSGKNVLKLAEEFKSVFGRNKLNKFIENNINDDKYIPGDLHKKLLSLNWRDVFTTNYDTLLERTIDKINVKFNYKILTNQNDLPGSTHPRIIKLHGSVDSSKNYIICEEDYRTYPVQYAPLVNTVQQAMLETQLCLIGFSGDDPNFLSWLGWLRDNMGENCPAIYLVGLFQNMSSSEKMTLENQNITIIDIGDMFDEKNNVGHHEALEAFLNKLTEYGQVKDKIFEPVPYKNMQSQQDFHKSINNKYFETMEEFLSRMKDKTNGYLAFPNTHETDRFIYSLKDHFTGLLKLEPSIQQINTLSKIVYLLRRGYSILEDPEANKVKFLIDAFNEDKLKTEKSLLASWVDVALYLLEMYRIDGRDQDYIHSLSKIEKASSNLDGYSKEELLIEKCKFLIASFDYTQAAEEIERINHSIALDIQLKKVFLYKQIGEDEKGKELLRKASAALAQKKYSEHKTASLKGYLNLCARSLMSGRESFDDSFSDKEYYSNSYNVRNIYNQIKNDVSNSLLLAYNESRGEKPGFNPGTYKVSYGTATKKEQDAVSKPLKYVMFQDLLCLPNTFSDHKEILALALKGIIPTSSIPTWKWSSIIRTNDMKIINAFFTRELIVSSDVRWIETISEQLFKLVDKFNSEESFKRRNRIITQETIYDILSRFSIVMEDDKVINLSEKIIEQRELLDDLDSRRLTEFFSRIRFSMSTDIFSQYLPELLSSDSIPFHFLTEFLNIDAFIDHHIELSDGIFNKVVDEIESSDGVTRDKGIAKIILIKSVATLDKYESKITEALWGQRSDLGFPKTSNFYASIWDNLPYPDNVDLENLYKNFLENPRFIRSVNEGLISGIATIDDPINEYIECFRIVSDFGKKGMVSYEFTWTSDFFIKIIKYIYEYLDNEKRVLTLKLDIFGTEKEGRKRFIKLGDFVAMLVAQAYLSEVYTNDVVVEVKNVRNLLQDNNVTTTSIDIIEKVIKDESVEADIDNLMNRAIIGKRDELGQAMNVINLLLVFEKKSVNNVKISNHLTELINSLKYFDLSRSSMVISKLISVIDHPLLIQEHYRSGIIKAFRQSIDKLDLSFNESNRELIDTIYSLSILIRKYYYKLIQNEISISRDLTAIVEELSYSKLKEVRYMWEEVQV
ncbi:SIR2 family NAD-dependent protein deacylase [Gracilibacillus saliphilus]|uniref:SIR2 family NAD-dependent protein deacylase n=1 Tax=Gracilibacillus saliphilus TaxID=543890 RepID=UPI0013D62657|nr:SIR2 family protein [Gracilibacillus saliphilus]